MKGMRNTYSENDQGAGAVPALLSPAAVQYLVVHYLERAFHSAAHRLGFPRLPLADLLRPREDAADGNITPAVSQGGFLGQNDM